MEKKDYSYYTTEELLQDDYFISSMRHPNAESKAFWDTLIAEGKVKKEEYELSRYFVLYIQVPKTKLNRNEASDMWMKIEVENKKRLQKMIRRLYTFGSVAAVACIVVLTGAIILFEKTSSDTSQMAGLNIQQIPKPEMRVDEVQLILANKNQVVLKEKQSTVEYSKKGEVRVNSQAVEQDTVQDMNEDEVAYNQLVTPKGRHSTLILSDGSKLWVNAGTYVAYPVVFRGKTREIYVDGEVFLEVAKDKAHPFVVKTNKLDVNVTGTSFNVCAYADDPSQAIVLVSGSVNIKTVDNIETTLIPNQLFTYTADGSQVKNVDVDDYILWKDGLYQYKSEKLAFILKRLSLYYGKRMECSDSVANIVCSGKLDLKEDAEKVLTGLAHTIRVQCKKENGVYYITNN